MSLSINDNVANLRTLYCTFEGIFACSMGVVLHVQWGILTCLVALGCVVSDRVLHVQ